MEISYSKDSNEKIDFTHAIITSFRNNYDINNYFNIGQYILNKIRDVTIDEKIILREFLYKFDDYNVALDNDIYRDDDEKWARYHRNPRYYASSYTETTYAYLQNVFENLQVYDPSIDIVSWLEYVIKVFKRVLYWEQFNANIGHRFLNFGSRYFDQILSDVTITTSPISLKRLSVREINKRLPRSNINEVIPPGLLYLFEDD
jgi:hypothetical protein